MPIQYYSLNFWDSLLIYNTFTNKEFTHAEFSMTINEMGKQISSCNPSSK